MRSWFDLFGEMDLVSKIAQVTALVTLSQTHFVTLYCNIVPLFNRPLFR